MINLNQVDVAILCGGLGTRLRSTIGESQKVLARIHDRPFLDILIKQISKQGIKKLTLLTGFKAEDVEGRYSNYLRSSLSIQFSKEIQPLGTGGALAQAQPLLKSEPFILMNGDSLCPVDLADVLNFHDQRKADFTMVLSAIENQGDFGSVGLNSEGRIISYIEKKSGRPQEAAALNPSYVNAGIYCFSQKIFKLLPSQTKFSLETDVFPNLVHQVAYGYISSEKLLDIGTPERYSQAQHKFKERN